MIILDRLVVLYTSDMLGDIDVLARLNSLITQRRAHADAPVLLLDRGGQCAESAWHCRKTQGVSMLYLLDAVGYDAMGVASTGYPSLSQHQAGLRSHLVDAEHAWRTQAGTLDQPSVSVSQQATTGYDLNIALTASPTTHIDTGTLYMADAAQGQLGEIHIDLAPLIIASHEIMPAPDVTRPDATFSSIVEFVLSEIR